MNKDNSQSSWEKDEVSLKELILKAKEYWIEVLKNWWLIILFSIPLIAFFVWKTYTTPRKYHAEIRFIVEGEGGGGLSGLGGLLGSFGLRKPGSTNPFKIIEVAKSKRLISEVLFQKDDRDSFLINKIIRKYKLDDLWKKRYPEMEGFQFKSSDWKDKDIYERVAFLSTYSRVVGPLKNETPLCSIGINDEEGIFDINVITEDEDISLALASNLFASVKYFFEEKVLEDQKSTRDLLKEKSDSLKGLVNYKVKSLARFEDQNRGLVKYESKIQKERIALEIQGLSTAYTESIKNYEIADYTYRDTKPFFLIIDNPVQPLPIIREKLISNVIMGAFLGGFLGVVFVFFKKVYRDTMKEDNFVNK